MIPEDRELLLALRQQQAELQRSLSQIDARLGELEARAGTATLEEPPDLPPIPYHLDLPDVPTDGVHLPPVDLPPLPSFSPVPQALPSRSFESHLGRWLTAVGGFFGVISLALILNYTHTELFELLRPGGMLALSAALGLGVIVLSERLVWRRGAARTTGQVLTVMALAWLYLAAYAAHAYPPVAIITSPVTAMGLLLLWSAYVLTIAGRRYSQTLAFFAIALAYVTTAMDPVSRYTLTTDLLLAGAAALFLVRRDWASLPYVALLGTYGAIVHRLLISDEGEFVFDTSRTLSFWTHATYTIVAWLIFTAAIVFATSPTFRRTKRLLFLSLNNAALAGLLFLTAYISGYGYGPMGWTLLGSGIALLFASRFVGFAQVEPDRLMSACAAQGLGLFTLGTMVVFTGVTRGVLLLVEALFLGGSATFSGDRLLQRATYFAAFFGAFFLTWEIAVNAHHPWILGFGGCAALLISAWWSRNDFRASPGGRSTLVPATAYYCALAVVLIFVGLCTALDESNLAPGLALAALGLTFLVYWFDLYELPPLAQWLLVIAQVLVLFHSDNGEEVPWWTAGGVTVVTLVMTTWWTRQHATRSGTWVVFLNLLYALALAGLASQTIYPRVDAQGWMICASVLAAAFLAWGAFTRVWTIAAVGQLFLVLAVWSFFVPPPDRTTPWNWFGLVVPTAVVYCIARGTLLWLQTFPETPAVWHRTLRVLTYGYQLLALAMLVRTILVLVTPVHQVGAFFFLGTLMVVWNLRRDGTMGVRCGMMLSLVGLCIYSELIGTDALALATVGTGLAFLAFLAQPALLRWTGSKVVTPLESWLLVFFGVWAAWLFVSVWVHVRFNPAYLTIGWAAFALFLYLFGRMVREPRQCWCAAALLLVTIVRVICTDLWSLSTGYKILTCLFLTVTAFSFGYFILRSAERAKRETDGIAELPPLPKE